MKNILRKILLLSLVAAGLSLQASAQTVSVNGSFEKTSIKRGGLAKGSIVLLIPEELHTNSNKPSSEFLIPTAVKASGAYARNFRAIYPKGKDRKFEFSETPLNVYEGETKIRFLVKIPKDFKAKTMSIKARVTYQACSNEVCYQPQEKDLNLKIRIR